MNLYRVKTEIAGVAVVGGGLSQMYFDASGTDSVDAILAVRDFWDELKAYAVTGTTFTVLGEVQVIDDATGDIVAVETDVDQVRTGTNNGDIAPPATQGLIRWRTGFYVAGREVRGRTFIPAMVSESGGRVPLSGTISDFNDAAAALVANADSALHIYSPTHHTSVPVTTGSMWGQWAVLRSRRD